MNRNLKNILTITIAILVIGLIPLAGGCTRTTVYIPEAIHLEPPPIMITTTQLYSEYMADEAAADARYKGKEVWITEAVVDTYLESENGCYLIMSWSPEVLIIFQEEVVFFLPALSVCTVKLEPEWSEGFKDVPPGYDVDLEIPITHEGYELGDFVNEVHIVTGYTVEVVGECQGISEGVIILEINRIAKAGGSLSGQDIKVY